MAIVNNANCVYVCERGQDKWFSLCNAGHKKSRGTRDNANLKMGHKSSLVELSLILKDSISLFKRCCYTACKD